MNENEKKRRKKTERNAYVNAKHTTHVRKMKTEEL